MLNETLKKRLAKDRPGTSITLRIPVDAVDSLKAIAPLKGFSGYQTLLKAYPTARGACRFALTNRLSLAPGT